MGRRGLMGGVGIAVVVGIAVAVWVGRGQGWASGARAAVPAAAASAVALEFTPAEVVQPVRAAMPLAVEFSGPLVAPATAIVRAKAAGTLLALRVAEGSRVKAGQPLGQIDLTDLQTRVADRSAAVESAQASLAEAQRQHAANEGLAGQDFISPTALQSSRAKLDAARAQLKSAQAQLATSQTGVREAALVAPISGIVGKRHALPGEKVSAEQALLTVVDLAVLELAGSVGTHEVSLLETGQPVQVRIEGHPEPVAGRIDRIAPAAEAGTRAIGVVVVIDNRGERWRAGQYAQARASRADPTQRLTVPAGAIGQASGQDFVWALEKDALVRRIVITGRRDPLTGRVEVTQGLPPDARVLAARFDNLKEGAPAKVVAQRAGPAAPAVPTGAASAPAAPRS